MVLNATFVVYYICNSVCVQEKFEMTNCSDTELQIYILNVDKFEALKQRTQKDLQYTILYHESLRRNYEV